MMNPDVPDDWSGLGADGAMVLWVNMLTGYAKSFLEDVLPLSWLPYVKRGYVVLPCLVAMALCVIQCGMDSHVVACGVKYGALASWTKSAQRTAIEGR